MEVVTSVSFDLKDIVNFTFMEWRIFFTFVLGAVIMVWIQRDMSRLEIRAELVDHRLGVWYLSEL